MSERARIDASSHDLPKPLEIPQWVEELLKDTTPVQYLNEDDDMVERPAHERVKELIEQKKATLQKLLKMVYRGLPALVLKDADLNLPVWTPTVTKLTGAQSGLQEWVESHPQWFPSDLDGIHDRMGMGLTVEDLEEWEKQSLPDTIKELLIELFNGMTSTIEAQSLPAERVQLLAHLTNGLQGSLVKLSKPIKEIHPYPFRKKLERRDFFNTLPKGEDIILEWPPHEGRELVYLGGEPPEAPVAIRAKHSLEDPTELSIPIPDDLQYPEDRMKQVYQPPSINDFPQIPQREFMVKSFDERVDGKRIRLCKIATDQEYAIVIDTDSHDPTNPQQFQRSAVWLEHSLGSLQWEVTFEHVLWWAQEQQLTVTELCKKTRERLRSFALTAAVHQSRRLEAAIASI